MVHEPGPPPQAGVMAPRDQEPTPGHSLALAAPSLFLSSYCPEVSNAKPGFPHLSEAAFLGLRLLSTPNPQLDSH